MGKLASYDISLMEMVSDGVQVGVRDREAIFDVEKMGV